MGAQRRCLQHLMTVCDGPLEVSGKLVCYEVDLPWPSLPAVFNEGGKSAVQWGKTNPGQDLPRNERTSEFQVFQNFRFSSTISNKRWVFFRTSCLSKNLYTFTSACVQSKVFEQPCFLHMCILLSSHEALSTLIGCTGPTCRRADQQGREFGWAFKQQLYKTANKQQIELVLCCLCLRVYVTGYIMHSVPLKQNLMGWKGHGSYVM